MIPKVIHYCWFGGKPIPEQYIKYMESWKKICPGYEIKEWNERNFDLSLCDYVKEAYEEKKWAFVSDYARLKIIYEEGGIYLDTDVELIKPLDDLLNEKCFLTTETTGYIATGLGFGAEKGSEVIRLMLAEYSGRHFRGENGVYDTVTCPKRNTDALKKIGFQFSDTTILRLQNCIILPPEYFCPIDCESGSVHITENTISVHHYAGSWISEKDIEINKKIDEINKNNLYVVAQIKKQWLLYNTQKENGKAECFIKYLISKVAMKLKLQ